MVVLTLGYVNMTINVYVVDYKSGNLRSIEGILNKINIKYYISNDPNIIKNFDAIILPGVGSFSSAMDFLSNCKLIDEIKKVIEKGVPIFGICLGFQLLFSNSNEFGKRSGLNFIEGEVLSFNKNKFLKIPNIGWRENKNINSWRSSPLKNFDRNLMYFVHSYYAVPKDREIITSTSLYAGKEFCTSIFKDNIFGTQFHPEKSGKEGIKIYDQFFKIFFQ